MTTSPGGGNNNDATMAVAAPRDLLGAASVLLEQLDAADLAYGQGTTGPADEAVWIAMYVMGLMAGTDDFDRHRELAVSDRQWLHMQDIARQRCVQRRPLAHVLGEAWFAGLRFAVTTDVLVPRSPMAELIVDGFQPWLPDSASLALDLCTGSGCLAIAMAHWLPRLEVHASDLSSAALAVAQQNRELHQMEQRLQLFQGDLFEALPGEPYDLIVCNPPYVGQEEYDGLPKEFQHEPSMGLLAAGEGLALVLRLLFEAPEHLSATGLLVCEVGLSQPQLERALPQASFTWLEFEQGGEGVFLLERESLLALRPALEQLQSGSKIATGNHSPNNLEH